MLTSARRIPPTDVRAGSTGPTGATGATGAGASLSSAILFGNSDIGGAAGTHFLNPGGFSPTTATTTTLEFPIPRSGSLKSLRIHVGTPGTGLATSLVYTLLVNGVATALSVTMLTTDMDGSDLVNIVAVAAGDLISLRVTKAAPSISPTDIIATIEFA